MTSIQWTVTTKNEYWQEATGAQVGPMTRIPSVFLGRDDPQQIVEGFGASFNELGWTALAHLSSEDRDTILGELFAPGEGANLSLCRMPVGANDFSRDWYSYDEVDGDITLEHFSIDNDLETLVPFIRAAQEHQPQLRLWASPWSPPTWMKTNGHYAGAQPMPGFQNVENGLLPEQVGAEGTDMIRVDDTILETYARYFGRFIDAYRELGITIGMVMPQNEFNSPQIFPSCTWTPNGLARFLPYLSNEMTARDVEVFLGTLERPNDRLVEDVLDNPRVQGLIDGVGVQWAGKHAAPYIHHAHPQLRIYQTEQECGDGQNTWRHARYAWSMLRHFFTHGANAYMYWNIALEDGGLSRWGWAQNSFVTVDPDTQTYRWNPEYYILKHVSHFVQTGARLIPTLTIDGHESLLAFENPNGDLIIVAQNDLAEADDLVIGLGADILTVTLPADSLSTFVVPAV